jgi:transposase, IS5 family
MTPKTTPPLSAFDLFRMHFDRNLNLKHELIVLSKTIDWTVFDRAFGPLFSPSKGRIALPTRLVVGLHFLKHTFNESDETVIERWLDSPYWQYFCGYDRFQHTCPIDPSNLGRWRTRSTTTGWIGTT